jgi:uncharacterized protein (TIGR03663 family)
MRRLAFGALIAAAVAIALAYRLPRLDERPMHTDEAVHAWKFNELWTQGKYEYDPEDYHGPTLYFATLPVMWLSGAATYADASEATFRIVPVLFGVGLILLLPLVADGIGRSAAAVAGLLVAISPAMSFYSRYYIQETLLAFLAFALIACGWRYVRSRRAGWLLAAGAAAGLMHATKETCVISLSAMAGAGAVIWLRWRSEPQRHRGTEKAIESNNAVTLAYAPRRQERRRARVLWIAAFALGALISVAMYSNLFRSTQGPLNSMLTYFNYFDRAGNFGLHDHPPLYYLKMLVWTQYRPGPVWSEALILGLAAVGIVAAFLPTGRRRRAASADRPGATTHPRSNSGDPRFLRFLALYALLLIAVYSAIPYKTPWCMLQFLHPLILLAGIGVVALFRGAHRIAGGSFIRHSPFAIRHSLTFALAAALPAGVAHLGRLAWLTNFRFHTDYRNPYVYAHPTRDVVRLGDWVERLAAVHPDGDAMLVQVVADDCWPLPWYLRRLGSVGYWDRPPERLLAPVIIVDDKLQPAVAARLEGYRVYHYGLRPDAMLYVYVCESLWRAFAASQGAGRQAPTQPAGQP